MQRPHLIIVAGCNGAGKSTYSHLLVDQIIPFDYDKRFLEIYNSLRDSEWREKFALSQTTEELNLKIDYAFQNRLSFCFETNFHIYPNEWINKAKHLGYKIDLYFFCLESIEIAKERVNIRTKNHGHFVSEDVIKFKWKEGYKNLNLHFNEFDYLLFFDNSKFQALSPIFELKKVENTSFSIKVWAKPLPEYAEKRFPNIFYMIQ